MKREIKKIPLDKKWMFYVDNKAKNLPYINMLDYTIIRQVVTTDKSNVYKRVNHLKYRGFYVKRCYVSNYEGLLQPIYMPRLNEIRIIVGRPKNHYCKEVYAVIIKAKN